MLSKSSNTRKNKRKLSKLNAMKIDLANKARRTIKKPTKGPRILARK